ncbi:hypothetical protein PFTANZ_00428 [Plasmodium falciparum Tanzania (2000708)]|uniref:J domain-containing protein n=1 Tax=Plasmodium falciparum Tanzania (2000708) TaxID=1036725 RepID=A0A024WEA0_PLAFA|nr:hypothetical protein PFTANZ_00428 [Plasmodium falciparum Tanzania (2000708)]
MKKNYYEILYVKQDFDINEIKRNNNLVFHNKFENTNETYKILSYQNRRKLYDSGDFDESDKMIIIVPFIFFNLIFTSDMMYEYIENTKVPIFVKLFFGKSIFIEDIFYYVGKIMKEMMEGQNIRELDKLLKDRLDLYIDNEDGWEKLMEN